MTQPLFNLKQVTRRFPVRSGALKRVTGHLTACDAVTMQIQHRGIVGLVGESGSGKTTIGRMLVRLLDPTEGVVEFDGRSITTLRGSALKQFRKDVQMLFQDPLLSLNPRRTVAASIAQPLIIHNLAARSELPSKVGDLLRLVGLLPADGEAYPHEMSAGALQKVALACALAVEPRFVFCDEPVSVLDASSRAQVLNLLKDIHAERSITLLVVSHDLTAVEYICDTVAVMYLGSVVEEAETADLFDAPRHPYSQALLRSVPERALQSGEELAVLEGEIPSPKNLPPGCKFNARCLFGGGEKCVSQRPGLNRTGRRQWTACHLVEPWNEKPDRTEVAA